MENTENYTKESQIVEIHTKIDILYLCSDLYNEQQFKKQLKEILKKIFIFNDFSISENLIKKYFNDYLNFIYQNLIDNTIKSNKDLKFYIQNELQLTIENEQYLFERFFNNKFKEIKNFLFCYY